MFIFAFDPSYIPPEKLVTIERNNTIFKLDFPLSIQPESISMVRAQIHPQIIPSFQLSVYTSGNKFREILLIYNLHKISYQIPLIEWNIIILFVCQSSF